MNRPKPLSTLEFWSQRDPTGEVNLEDPHEVASTICLLLDRHYAGQYAPELIHSTVTTVACAYRGEYPGLLRCDTPYHDLRHSLEATLTTARLLDGYAKCHAPSSESGIDAEHAVLGILLAIFHDIGLLRRSNESHIQGASLTPVHEERSVEFAQSFLQTTALAHLLDETKLIMATKLVFKVPETWSAKEKMLASLVVTADLLSQLSDRCYLEKCRDFLFFEFSTFGVAGKPDSPYPDSDTLLKKTPAFIEGFLRKRLDEEFQGVHRYLQVHCEGADPWQAAVQRNLDYLKALLNSNDIDKLRRHPTPFVGDSRATSGA